MKDLAYRYYFDGWGCGQCIIKAADTKYALGLNGELIKAVSAAGNGFGYSGLYICLMKIPPNDSE